MTVPRYRHWRFLGDRRRLGLTYIALLQAVDILFIWGEGGMDLLLYGPRAFVLFFY